MADPAPQRARQLALDLPVDERRGVEDFLVSDCNEAAYSHIESWPHWPDQVLRLLGPEGSGKSHLAAIWAARAHGWTISAREITHERVPHLASAGALVIEDADKGVRDEAALFHLVNLVRARKGHLLVTARTAPDAWGLATPDLLSRLRLSPAAEIGAPDDALLRAVLVKHFVDRQLVVDVGTVEALALRMERSFAAARDVVEKLDRLSLEHGRRITRSMAAGLFAEAGE
jgi:chromosomal replication initiation ATPase DnaA